MRTLMAMLLLATIGCAGSPTEPKSLRTVTLRFGETTTVSGTRISFTDVTDSRCAKDVVCAWEGDAAIRLESGTESVVLHTSTRIGVTAANLGGVHVTLTAVRPERITLDEPKKSEYLVTLQVSG
jgi:hypothetical protein